MDNYNTNLPELDWDSTIENESTFVLLPEGEYPFTVVSFERGYHNGSEKLPACPKAILQIEVQGASGTASIKHNLFISRKTEGLLCAFFLSIGQKKHGEPLRMDWNRVVGSSGRCKIGIYKSNTNGNEYNEIKSFLESPEKTAPAAPAYNPPKYAAPRG